MLDEKTKSAFENRKKEMSRNEYRFNGDYTTCEEIKRVDLVDLHNKYRELLYIEDTNRIDIVLAVALSRKLAGIPLWLIIVGPSGDMKSVQMSALKNDDSTYILHNLTSKTLVNGYKDKFKHPDLAPLLDGKLVIIPDMAQLLKLPPVEKGELWGQLRDLYDGNAGKASGQGSDSRYEDLKITLIAGSTPAIDGQILVHQDLGTRELIYRTRGNKNKERVMEKCLENEEFEENITRELRKITETFLRQTKIKRDVISRKILDEIKNISSYVTIMRASAEFDGYENSLRNIVYPEEPTRIIKQLKRLYICLMSLAEDYPEEKALNILREVALSSSFPIRTKIFDYLLNQEKEFSTSQVARELKIGKSTAQRELSMLWNVELVERRDEETGIPERFIYYWSINNKSPITKTLISVHRNNT